MSYTLKKLKQSEMDHGYKKPTINTNANPSYGSFILCFVITLCIFLVLLDQGKEVPTQQKISSSKAINDSINEPPVNSTLKKELVNVNPVYSSKENEKIILLEEKVLETELSNKTISTPENITVPTKHIEPNQIAQSEKEILIENTVNLEAEPKEQDILEANTETQTAENNSNDIDDIAPIVSNRIKNKLDLDNEDSSIQNNQPVLWQDLPESFKTSMPEMKLNGIVYLDNEKDRYIFINMTKYQIDDIVQETGPTVEEIKQHSVIMQYEDKLFILTLTQ